jgi:hypothetical protein
MGVGQKRHIALHGLDGLSGHALAALAGFGAHQAEQDALHIG